MDDKPFFTLVIFGDVETEIVDYIGRSLHNFYVSIKEESALPINVIYHQIPGSLEKEEHCSPDIFLDELEVMPGLIHLGITEKGVYSVNDKRCVFGFGRNNGYKWGGILSTYRFRKKSNDRNKFKERLGKEIIKILGLCLGLGHCEDNKCIFSYHRHVEDLDTASNFCEDCREEIIRAHRLIAWRVVDIIEKYLVANTDELLTTTSIDEGERVTPSVSQFLSFYERRDYYRALGLSMNASRNDLRDAIDRFEIEHLDRSGEWSIPMATIKEMLLKPQRREKRNETKKVDPFLRNDAKSLLSEAEKYYYQRNFEKALEKANKIVFTDPLFADGYEKRGDINRRIGEEGGSHHNFELAVKDCIKSLEIEPTSQGYVGLGLCYVDIGGKENLKKASEAYQKALELSPSSIIIALDKMELEICMGRYKNVVGLYGEWNPSILFSENEIIAASLVCIALALDGKSFEGYIEPLLNKNIKVRWTWSTFPIDNCLARLVEEGYYPDRVARAKEIQDIFREHYVIYT